MGCDRRGRIITDSFSPWSQGAISRACIAYRPSTCCGRRLTRAIQETPLPDPTSSRVPTAAPTRYRPRRHELLESAGERPPRSRASGNRPADEVSDVLRLVDDPELGMNIVDLGLVSAVRDLDAVDQAQVHDIHAEFGIVHEAQDIADLVRGRHRLIPAAGDFGLE